jgi:hypothetical protein
MPNVVVGVNQFPSLEDVTNLVRSLVNDDGAGATDTVGEGQIFVDNPSISPAMQRLLNASLKELYRELRIAGDPTLIADNYVLTNLPVIFGPEGQGVASPETQQSLGFQGFFDGTQQYSTLTLPPNLISPLRMWERATGSSDAFSPMSQSQFGLAPIAQGWVLGQWEWRSGAIWLPGSLQNRDIRLRYRMSLPAFYGTSIDFSTTYIPIIDCVDAVAYKVAAKYAMRLSSPEVASAMDALAKEQMQYLKNESVRQRQSIDYNRTPFEGGYGSNGSGNGPGGWGGLN